MIEDKDYLSPISQDEEEEIEKEEKEEEEEDDWGEETE